MTTVEPAPQAEIVDAPRWSAHNQVVPASPSGLPQLQSMHDWEPILREVGQVLHGVAMAVRSLAAAEVPVTPDCQDKLDYVAATAAALPDQLVEVDRITRTAQKELWRLVDEPGEHDGMWAGQDRGTSAALVSAAAEVEEYGGHHRPSRAGVLHDLLGGDPERDVMPPDDFYDKPHLYTGYPGSVKDTARVMRRVRGKPDATVTVYRAAPPEATHLNTGDWVTLHRGYAEDHARDHSDDPERPFAVHEAEVPAKHVEWAGDDLAEWGYWGPSITAKGNRVEQREQKTAGYAEHARDAWLWKADRWPEDADRFRANAEREHAVYSDPKRHSQPGQWHDKRPVGWVRRDKLEPYLTHQGDQHGGSQQTIDALTDDFRHGRGWTDPIHLDYSQERHRVTMSEGNHRWHAATKAGEEYVPVVVHPMSSYLPARWSEPAVFPQAIMPEGQDSVHPSEVLPLHWMMPEHKEAAAHEPVSWDQITERHPDTYGVEHDEEEGDTGPGEEIAHAAGELAFDRPDEPSEDAWHHASDLDWHLEHVDPRHIDHDRVPPDDSRVRRAIEGYQKDPESVPPLVLVRRHGVYQVADGHHRASAAEYWGMPVRAYVAHSPHEDEPFSGHDGEPPARGPFHGAEPIPARHQAAAESDLAAYPEGAAPGDVDTTREGAAEAAARMTAEIDAAVARAARETEEAMRELAASLRDAEHAPGELLHRGVMVEVDPDDLAAKHAEGGMEAVHRHIADAALRHPDGLGTHWTSDPAVARRFAHGAISTEEEGPRTTLPYSNTMRVPVVLHAHVPAEAHETDPEKLRDAMVIGHGWSYGEGSKLNHEAERLLRPGAPVHVTNVEAALPAAHDWLGRVEDHRWGDEEGHRAWREEPHSWQSLPGVGHHVASLAAVPTDWDRFRGHPLGTDEDGVSYHYYPAEGGRWPVVKARVGDHPDAEELHGVGDLTWFEEDGPGAVKNAVQMVEVHPDYRRHGIASRLWAHARRINPDLIHSPTDQLPEGTRWAAAIDARKEAAVTPYQPPELPEAQRTALEHPDFHTHRRMIDEVAANPPPGTKIWRGETRVVDEHGVPDHGDVGLHWSANPEGTINHAYAAPGQRQVIWQATVEHPSQTIPRDHPSWGDKDYSRESEAEVRLRPGTQVKVDGAWVFHAKPWDKNPKYMETPGSFVPMHPGRMHPSWRWHPVGERSLVTNEHGKIDYGDRLPSQEQHGGLTGRELSDAVVAAGHDGIITHDQYGTSEIVDLTGLRPSDAKDEPDQGREAQAAAKPAVPSFTWRYQTQTSTGYEDRERLVEGPFYHGSRSKKLREGDTVRPGFKTNNWGDEGEKASHVHFSTNLAGAASYAREAGGHVYEVEPTGEVQGGYSGEEFKSQHPLRVIRRVSPEELSAGPHEAALGEAESHQEATAAPTQAQDTPKPRVAAKSSQDQLWNTIMGRDPHDDGPAPERQPVRQVRHQVEPLDDETYSVRDVDRANSEGGLDTALELEDYKVHPRKAEFRLQHVPVDSLRIMRRRPDGRSFKGQPFTSREMEAQDEDGDTFEHERLESIREGHERGALPPILVVRHGRHHLILDGSHRAGVAMERGETHIPAYVTDDEPEARRSKTEQQHEAATNELTGVEYRGLDLEPDPNQPEDAALTRGRLLHPTAATKECESCGGAHATDDHDFENEFEDNTQTDWDEVWPEVGPHLHRGVGVELPDHVHRVVHDEARPVHERAQALLDHLASQPQGMHWSEHPDVAEAYATSPNHGHGPGRVVTPVRLTVRKPDLSAVETDADRLRAAQVYGNGGHDEAEVPIREGAPLEAHAISWGDHGATELAHHHAVDAPAQVHAAEDDDLDFPDDEEDEETSAARRTDWDSIYPKLPKHLHRGMNVHLPDAVHQVVHDPQRPHHERAAALLEHLRHGLEREDGEEGGLGMHWTGNGQMARRYATDLAATRGGTPVHVTVRRPERSWIEEDPHELARGDVVGHGQVAKSEYYGDTEVPISHGAPLDVHSVSWGDHGGWDLAHHHTLSTPIRAHAHDDDA